MTREVVVRPFPGWHLAPDVIHIATLKNDGHDGIVTLRCTGEDTVLAWNILPEGTAPNCIVCIAARQP